MSNVFGRIDVMCVRMSVGQFGQLGIRASIGHMTRKVHADADAGQRLMFHDFPYDSLSDA
jgi:hypothetical protein